MLIQNKNLLLSKFIVSRLKAYNYSTMKAGVGQLHLCYI
ncbi:hypothetical protein cd3_072 [Carnobacterium phage cd3]|uniref:Uncharacterized protein n=2 Tax=Carnodivirus TaxID=3044682 RepID=A0AAE7SST3_9CAUD|nr:hypothetical protein PQD68_gp072 [Carnobacterium phage cd2]YP_010676537.1 hypothetical protein PQD69_gp071 [Carnobacterium phage cd4]QXP45198.1 hypothetical protein cd2_072 [Carnobacterium phage cd2]QXP45247.1 hypothetical protein cd3_072 [Carnobacterium phage cd3]QXP45331.1 hypothetical protein cd4_071 [Carnobacterium phage cd4]